MPDPRRPAKWAVNRLASAVLLRPLRAHHSVLTSCGWSRWPAVGGDNATRPSIAAAGDGALRYFEPEGWSDRRLTPIAMGRTAELRKRVPACTICTMCLSLEQFC
jgi:hypothetical protein